MSARTARVGRSLDVVGVALVAALASWASLVSGGDAARVASLVTLLAALVAAVVAGRWLGDRGVPVAAGVAGATLSTLVLTYPGVRAAAGAPTGYANANATLAAVGAIAAIGAARAVTPGGVRRAWVFAAGVLGGATALTGSVAGGASLAMAGVLLGAAAVTKRPGVVPGFGLVLVLAVAGLTGTAAVDADTPLGRSDAVRVDLWQAGAELARNEPITGLGVGAFQARHRVADADLRWVHHEFIELALELGAVGLLLVFAIAACAAARLWVAAGGVAPRGLGLQAETAAAAVTALGLHGTVDHVWHAPAPMVLVALLFGAAGGSGGVLDRRLTRRADSLGKRAR